MQLVFFVLSPALVGSNLAKYITLRSLPELWFMPLNVLITFVIGSVLGWLLVKIAKAPKGLRGVIMGCCAAGSDRIHFESKLFLQFVIDIQDFLPDILPMPMRLSTSLACHPSMQTIKFLHILPTLSCPALLFSPSKTCRPSHLREEADILFPGNLGNMLLVIVLAVCKEKGSPFGVSDVCTSNGMAYVSLSMAIGSIYIWSYVYNIIVRIYSGKDSDEAKPDVLPEGAESAGERNESAKCRTGPPLPSEDPSLGESRHLQLAKVPFPENIKRSFLKFIKKPSIRRLFAPAIIGAIVGLMIGIIPPFKKVLIGDSAPLHAVEDSADMVGSEGSHSNHDFDFGSKSSEGFERLEDATLGDYWYSGHEFALPPANSVGVLIVIDELYTLITRSPQSSTMSMHVWDEFAPNLFFRHRFGRYIEPVIWSWPNRMLRDHAMDPCLGHSLADRLVNILHLVC
ncbi:hypothetical protein H0E87_002616 [Populus deltoides]|uniref:Auxin efflux carrier family protein n=1 Tax=Populus deltoides TaxID=3696 RepID=A0A8T2ZW58_POPDE|nr:hypothetical protein H0E87_002616 [Populus deltoides]